MPEQQLKGSGLGRGLSSLIPKKALMREDAGERKSVADLATHDVADEIQEQHIVELSPRAILTNPHQPRRDWREDQDFQDLVSSVQKHGILQPLVVTRNRDGKYELVAGERRLRAAKQLNLSKVPCILRSVGELEKLELALIENIQRKDLNPIERAMAYRKLIDQFSLSHEEAAKRLGKSRPVVTNTLRYLQLPSEIQKALAEGRISEGQAKTILELKTEAEQLDLFERVVKDDLTVAAARNFVAKKKGGGTLSMPIEALSRLGASRMAPVSGDAEAAGIEAELEQALGTKVRIVKRGHGGEIRIEYYSQEELASLISKLVTTSGSLTRQTRYE